ncbi:glycosyltransferase [Dyella humicola]|uniref:glycosyltransferase n=1 Tax=Dyella humicola TaxID=2992126 RepID=UPI00224E60CF
MRILLIAYGFPPLASPQAIRWYYLTRELVKLGVDVHVLAPDLPSAGRSALELPAGVVVHRCHAGGFAAWVAQLKRPRAAASAPSSSASVPAKRGLNWKGRLYQKLDALIGLWTYSDNRGQWRKFALGEARRVIEAIQPDAIVSSHEPPVSLEVGLQCGRGRVWLADLGDPVLAPYTPKRWHRRAWALEESVCDSAAAVSVTTEATRKLLIERHGAAPDKILVLPQGYDDALPIEFSAAPPINRQQPLQLLYTGRFYAFRDPTALLEAVLEQDDVQLTIVAPEISADHLALIERSQGRIVFLGEQPHARALALQQACDVLVNIGNALDAQTPGKLFEYLGSGKPVLHCYSVEDDPANALIAQTGRGWSCRNRSADLRAFLQVLTESPERCYGELSNDVARIAAYGWSRLAQRWLDRCRLEVTRARAG